MQEKYVRLTFKRNGEAQLIGKVFSDLEGGDLADCVEVSDEWMDRFFGKDEAGYWELEEVEPITKEEALRCEREIDIDTFSVGTTEAVE